MKAKQLTTLQRTAAKEDLVARIKEIMDDIPALAEECLERLLDSEHANIVRDHHFDGAQYAVPKAFIVALARKLEEQNTPPYPGIIRTRQARRARTYFKHM